MCVYIAIIATILSGMLWCMDGAAALQLLWVGMLAGKALRERQCTLKGGAWYVNVWGSVYC